MKFIVIFTFLAASAVLAKPLQPRYATTEYEYPPRPVVTVTVTVTGDPSQTTITEDSSTTLAASYSTSTTAEETAGSTGAAASSTSASTSASTSSVPPPSSSSSSIVVENSSSTSTSQALTPGQTKAASDYVTGILDQHNNHRDNASVSALTWSDDLAAISQRIAESCVYQHNTSVGPADYGQNIGAGATPEQVPALITNFMYNGEIELYPGYGIEPDMSRFESWGHYSQIVWNSTAEVGCATVHCSNGLANTAPDITPYFTVCNYRPSGNVGGAYAENVFKPKGMPMVVV